MIYALLFLLCALAAAWAVVALAHWHWLLGVLVTFLECTSSNSVCISR